jgi:hypothetical protein
VRRRGKKPRRDGTDRWRIIGKVATAVTRVAAAVGAVYAVLRDAGLM